MAKKILAIFFVSILLCSYIIPTTSAFADVVIGDNDSYAVTELGVENGKKIATMEAILQLLESGVSEINFNDISDLDDYLDDFYDELTNVNYQDVSNEILAGAYNDVKELKQWIDDRGEYIATYYKDYLNSADQGLSDIFNQFQLKMPKSKLVGTSLNGFRSLSRFNGDNPTPQPDVNYQSLLNKITTWQFIHVPNWSVIVPDVWNANYSTPDYTSRYFKWDIPRNNRTYLKPNGGTPDAWDTAGYNHYAIYSLDRIVSFNITGDDTNGYYVTGTFGYQTYIFQNTYTGSGYYDWYADYNGSDLRAYKYGDTTPPNFALPTSSFNNLYNALYYLVSTFKNFSLYVNGVPWVLAGDIPTNPTLDIDGIIKLYGNDNPIQYEFPQGTQIDYNALYNTIYNAIRDNLPLDMQTINNNQVYYDSHDTVYSPTIYNYYGKDGDDENDWIDSILDYATIPDFNAVLGTVAVLDTPFVNGITIINAGVTDVIPSDILLILGGFFVLVLFVCIINRMSE